MSKDEQMMHFLASVFVFFLVFMTSAVFIRLTGLMALLPFMCAGYMCLGLSLGNRSSWVNIVADLLGVLTGIVICLIVEILI